MISRGWKCSRTKGVSEGGALLMARQSYRRRAPMGPPPCDERPWKGANAAGGGANGGKNLPRRGGRSMAEQKLPKLTTRGPFPSPAPPPRKHYSRERGRARRGQLV